MSEIQVTSAQLRAKAEELSNYNKTFRTTMESLNETEATLRAEYVGGSSDAFDAAYKKSAIQMSNFANAIDNYVTQLLAIAANYEQAEATATTIASS